MDKTIIIVLNGEVPIDARLETFAGCKALFDEYKVQIGDGLYTTLVVEHPHLLSKLQVKPILLRLVGAKVLNKEWSGLSVKDFYKKFLHDVYFNGLGELTTDDIYVVMQWLGGFKPDTRIDFNYA